MAAHKFHDSRRVAVKAAIAAGLLAGQPQTQIAAELHVTQQLVSFYKREMDGEWQAAQAGAIDAVKARELARIDLIEEHAWAEYFHSQEDATQVTRTQEPPADGTATAKARLRTVRTVARTEGRLGDPRYLDRIAWCVEQRLRIYGLYAQPGESTATVIIKAYTGIDLEQM